MDSNEGFSSHAHRPGGGNPQLVVITQLLQIITNMHYIDELFLWLSYSIFLLSQADMLTRYNLHYWESTCLSNNVLLPPTSNDPSLGAIPTPLAMIASLFTYQPSNANLLATVTRILEYALSIAKNRGLLLSATKSSFSSSASPLKDQRQSQHDDLGNLIPHRAQSINTVQRGNPLSRSVIISDKQARRL